MHLSTLLDCDLVALETEDELTLLVELTAPVPETTTTRPQATLQIVLDRSGSMGGGRLEGAKQALIALVDTLDPTDNLGVVAFDNTVEVVVPAGPLTDKARVKQAISRIQTGGTTDLSSGYLRGLQEARRVAGPSGATVLIISDGHANAGITDPDQLGKVAVDAQTHRVTTSTLGFGLGYDERLLAALARGGAGNELFAEEADTAVALIGGEVDGLLTQVAQAASLRVTWSPHVAGITVLNDLPVVGLDDGVMLELGSFYAGETRKLLLTLRIPGIPALGLTQVATLAFTHVALPELVQHQTTVPVLVNVVPGDEAAGRVPDPVVRSEALFQRTQQAKRKSSRLLSEGRLDEASLLMRSTSRDLRASAPFLPDAMATELLGEADLFDAYDDEARFDVSRAAKASSYSASIGSRNRGRKRTGGKLALSVPGDPAAEPMVLDEWEVQRLRRPLEASLAAALSPSSELRDAAVAAQIAAALGEGHPAHGFFASAAQSGGFLVSRA